MTGRWREAGRWAVAWTALLLAACASSPETRTVLPLVEAADGPPAAGYEALPSRSASEILSAELLAGPHHRVLDPVESDGFVRLYRIESSFGEFEAQGDDMLRVRVHEIGALAELDAMSKTQEFAEALARGLKSPFVATWNLIRHPVDSIVGVPVQAWNVIKKTADLTRRERGELEDSGFRELIGFEAKKRELAYRLGVDPYSSNRVLQRELNRFAWVSFAGGLPFAFVPFQGERAGDAPAGEPETMDRMAERLRYYSPEDLRRLNRIELAVLGLPQELADRFLRHPWYSPRHATALVKSLAAIETADGIDSCLEAAATAESEWDAGYHERSTALLRAYHENERPVARLLRVDRTAVGLTEDGTLVVPALVDHAVWTQPGARFFRALATEGFKGARVERRQLLVSGTLSERARAELERLGFAITEHAFERLAPAPVARSGGAP